jgi:hypothetical protein
MRGVARFENNDDTDQWLLNHNIAIIVQASNANQNTAIMMNGGWISGLAIHVLRIDSNTTLTNTNVYVSFYNSSSITVTLPANPENGKIFYLRQMNSTGFVINGNGKSIHTGTSIETSVGNRAGQGDTTMLVYDGQYWNMNYMPR